MHKIGSEIRSFLQKYNLDNKDLIYLVGFSGGFDSMCLLNELKKTVPKNKIIALHLNHKWRGAQSNLEEKNCKDFCEEIGVEFYSEDLPKGVSQTETAARKARYEFFERCAKKFNSNVVFTAHNKNDNAETIIYRLCTGTGVMGLQGISENRDIYYRPLLNTTRIEIENYCKKNNLNPNNDTSNFDKNYKRNYIRAEVIPALLKVNSNVVENIHSLSEIALEESEIINRYMEQVEQKIVKDEKIDTQKFLKLPKAVQTKFIYNIFIDNNLDYDRKKIFGILDFIYKNSKLKSGKTCSLTSDLWLFVSEKIIQIIAKNGGKQPSVFIIKEGCYETESGIFEIEKFTKQVRKFPSSDDDCAYVDLSKFDFGFELRTRQDGDVIRPYGLGGSQKLKKYLNAKKIPNHEKDSLIFLAQDNEILWAVNVGISDKIKVVKNPTHRLKYTKKR